MASRRFRLRVDEVDAIQFTGDNLDEVKAFIAAHPDSQGRTTLLLPCDEGWNPAVSEADEAGVTFSVEEGEWIIAPGFCLMRPDEFARNYVEAT